MQYASEQIIKSVNEQQIKSGLYIVSTPIGNIGDVGLRAVNILNRSNIILCEDTRLSFKMLSRLGIKDKVLLHYNDFILKQGLDKIIEHLKQGDIISIISDAGTPLVSDPGHLIVQASKDNGIEVFTIPGACALSSAISLAGFMQNEFCFMGFFDEDKIKKIKSKDLHRAFNIIFFENPKSLPKTLSSIGVELQDESKVGIAREISKIHEEFFTFNIKDLKADKKLSDKINNIKGEIVLLLYCDNLTQTKSQVISEAELCAKFFADNHFAKQIKTQDCIQLISQIYPNAEINKKILYAEILNYKK